VTNRTDNFTRADTTNNIGTPSDSGSAWVQQSGTWGISSNQGYASAGQTQATCVLDSSSSNVDVQVTWATVGTDDGIIARSAGDNDYLLMTARPSGFNDSTLYKKVGGSYTQLATHAASWVNGDVLKLTVDSSNLITCYRNGASLMSATDSAGSTNTKHGLRTNTGAATAKWTTFSITDSSGGTVLDEDAEWIMTVQVA
jgi:hypothetical protein